MLFRKDIEPRCAYCTQGVRINETQVACVKGALWRRRIVASASGMTP